MFYRIMKFWFTGKDNESYEIMRALTALSVLVMLGSVVYHLIANKTFDPVSVGAGLGALLFGGGAGSAIKDGTLGKPAKVMGDLNAENIENVEMQPQTMRK